MGDGVDAARYHKRDLWKEENTNYYRMHFRLVKAAALINRMAGGEQRTLLDVGCGPATVASLLAPGIDYYGIDIAIQEPAPNLLESDLLENPIRFGDKRFDIVLAQGFFEYVGEFQAQKLAEIADILADGGTFVTSYVNFGHRNRDIYWLYNNVQPIASFRAELARHFTIRRCFPTSHNWQHTEPNRKLIRAANMRLNVNVPVVSPKLAVQYFFICSQAGPRQRA